MYDFGEYERKQFLADEQRNNRPVYWLLLITSLYVIIHVGLYLWRNYVY